MSSWGDLPPEARTEIERLIPEGKRIEAIRVYRRHSDVTLKEAKDAIDSVAAGMGIEFSAGSSLVRSCWVVALAFLAWMGLIAAMPFLAKFVLIEVFGDSVSPGLTETIMALSALFAVFVSIAVLIVWIAMRNRRQCRQQGSPEN